MKKVAEVKFLEQQGMYLTTEQAAEYLGVTEKHLRNLRQQGKGPKYEYVGNRRRIVYKRSELVAWYYAFKTPDVRGSEARIETDNAVVDYELSLNGAKVLNLLPNLKKAISAIHEEIIKNCADGFLCFEYRYCGIKAQMLINKTKYVCFATCVFSAE